MRVAVYRNTADSMLRLAIEADAALPEHLEAAEWTLVATDTTQISDEVCEDIRELGFSVFKLISP